MDHHCPWTVNCVSHRTFPHFIRFLLYAVVSIWYLEYFLYQRGSLLWSKRHLPHYLGPSHLQLVHFLLLILSNSLTLFALTVLLVRCLWILGANTTTIEGWEIERHETLVRRARYLGGYLDGPDGQRVRIVRQEFPYDVGIWANVAQGMGTSNPLAWLVPLAPTPPLRTGLAFAENGFEDDPSLTWPPPDPDRIPRRVPPRDRAARDRAAFTHREADLAPDAQVVAFRARQGADLRRRGHLVSTLPPAGGEGEGGVQVRKRRTFLKRYEGLAWQGGVEEDGTRLGRGDEESEETEGEGEEGWRNSEGERLGDFGVDAEADFYDERDEVTEENDDDDDVPLSQLMERKRMRLKTQ